MNEIVIAHMYPRRMNIYGDTGNVIALTRRLAWRGMPWRLDHVGVGDDYSLLDADVVVAGGGEDSSQVEVAHDLVSRGDDVRAAVASGVAMLVVCGTYQLFGRRFVTADGSELPGIGVFAAETVAGPERMIGNVVAHASFGRLVGFENHGGRTTLDPDQEALARVEKGYGNDGESRLEGAVAVNCFGTYLHGSVLPKNPVLADELLRRGMARRHPGVELGSLDDSVELAAAESASKRP